LEFIYLWKNRKTLGTKPLITLSITSEEEKERKGKKSNNLNQVL